MEKVPPDAGEISHCLPAARTRFFLPGTMVPVTVVLAEGAILDRVLDTAHSIESEGLSRHAYAQFDAAQTRTAWGRRHRRRFALMEGNDVLASATQCDLAAVLD